MPLDLYLKHTSSSGKFVLSGGGGANYVMASTDYKYKREFPTFPEMNYSEKATFTQKKVIPHLQAGGELFLSKRISLNFGVKYLFSAVLDNLTGDLKTNGVSDGKKRMTMVKDSFGEAFSYKSTSSPSASNERPFKYDLSGLRVNFGLKAYF